MTERPQLTVYTNHKIPAGTPNKTPSLTAEYEHSMNLQDVANYLRNECIRITAAGIDSRYIPKGGISHDRTKEVVEFFNKNSHLNVGACPPFITLTPLNLNNLNEAFKSAGIALLPAQPKMISPGAPGRNR